MRRKGFTLIELLVVIGILAVIVSIVVGVFGGHNGRHEEYQTAPRVSTPVYNDDPPVEHYPSTNRSTDLSH